MLLGSVNMNYKSCLAIVLVVLISSCSSQPQNPPATEKFKNIAFNYGLFDSELPHKNTYSDIFHLTTEQKDNLLAQVNKRIDSGKAKHIALSEFLASRLSNFTYYGETYEAEKSARLNKGNCMSLAVLTGAFAEAIDLEYSFREITTLPVFDKQNNLILSSTHVQTILYDESFLPEEDYIYISKPGIVIDYFPSNYNLAGKKVSKSAFISMYYKNFAADALIDDQLSQAFRLA